MSNFIKELKEEANQGEPRFSIDGVLFDFEHERMNRNRATELIMKYVDRLITRTALRTLEEVKKEAEKMVHKHDPDDEVSKYHFMSVGKNEAISKMLESLSHLQDEIKKNQ